MPDPTSRLDSLGPFADQRRLSAPRMMSGQFPDEILDPAIRKLERKLGVVLDRNAVRARLEQEVGFADYGKYSREQLIEGLRLLKRDGGEIELRDGTVLRSEDIGDLAEHIRGHFPEPGPQKWIARSAARLSPQFTRGRVGSPTPGPQASVPGSFRAGARAPEKPGRLDVALSGDVISPGSARPGAPRSLRRSGAGLVPDPGSA
jgi:hypothetical protein